MNHKRQICINLFSKVLELENNDSIILNLEKGIFNETIKYCQNNKYELKWSNINLKKKI